MSATKNKALRKRDTIACIVQQGVDKIKGVSNYEELRTSVSLVHEIGNLLENTVKKKHKVDKLDLLFQIFDEVYKLSDDEKKEVVRHLDDLISSKRIKKDGYLKIILRTGYNIFAYFFLLQK